MCSLPCPLTFASPIPYGNEGRGGKSVPVPVPEYAMPPRELSRLILLDRIEIGLKRLRCIDLVATLCVKDPIPYESLCLPGVLRVVDPYVNVLFSRLHFCRSVDWGLIDIADLAKAPTCDIGEILFSNLDSIYE